MAKYYMKEESLTSIADSIRNIYEKTGKLTCGDMASDLGAINDEVGEQSELVDKIARKFVDIDLIKYLDGTIETVSNNNVTNIGSCTFNNCDSLTSVNLPSVTSIGYGAFQYCDSLTTIDLPNATSIESYAFSSCTSLTSINLPNAISIRSDTFYDCNSLTTIDLPNVTDVGEGAFYHCNSLTTVIIRTNTLCALKHVNTFINTPIQSGTGYIYVPKALIEDYKVATNWSTYASQFRALEDYPEICGQEVAV